MFRDWMKENFEEQELYDMASHGVEGGFSGLIYYSDTVKLFEEHKDEIFNQLAEDTENMGYKSIYELLATFNKDHMPWNYDQFANQLVWYMAETVAREQVS